MGRNSVVLVYLISTSSACRLTIGQRTPRFLAVTDIVSSCMIFNYLYLESINLL